MKIARFNDRLFVPASHEDLESPGVLKKVLFKTGDIVKGEIQMVNWAMLPIGKSFVTHYHENMDEVFVIVTGSVEAVVGNEKTILSRGDGIVIPMKTRHTFKNVTNNDVEYIVFGISNGAYGKTITVGE